ncbi:MATE family efflux transporter [Vibrio sp. 10N.261.55.A7]|uniref:MATE family efflux transporter n=1 Tax=Vibrio sp. 10N.261.55.A7 TaxID=1880851 RepID=UPI000C849211|nr:MATE family efflux transporter [Vibrio sp. 10N.261.55.A7]PMJ93029.1 multidrug efflux protein [Vibrio sp. 10N.261.55.A7]
MSNTIVRQFWRYTIPTVAAMLVNGLYQVVDGIFIGRYVGADGLAAINLAWPIIGTILGIGMMIGVGTGALVSIKQGENNALEAKQILATGLLILLAIAPIVAVSLWFLSDDLLLLQGGEGKVLDLGVQYLEILIVTSIFALGSIAMPFLLRNDDSPNLATLLMIIGAVVNIGLDFVFIAWFGWELKGAAIATGIAQSIVTIMGLAYFFSDRAKVKLTMSCLVIRWDVISQILFIGASSFFMYAYGSMMIALHNVLFTQYGSMMLVGAYAVIGYIVTVYYLTVEGVANGMQPLVSFNYGAKHFDNVRRLLNIAMVTAVVGGIAFVALLNLFPYQSVMIFNSTDGELIDAAILGVRLHLFALFLDGFLVVTAAYYQAVNRGSKAMFVTIGNMLIQLPFLYILPKIWGIDGVWIAYPLSNIALSAVVILMLLKDLKKFEMKEALAVRALKSPGL